MTAYKMKYTLAVDYGNFTEPEVSELGDNTGAADSLFVVSVIHEEGGMSIASFGLDGQTKGAITAIEIFKIWTLLAADLKDSAGLSSKAREIASKTLEEIRKSTD